MTKLDSINIPLQGVVIDTLFDNLREIRATTIVSDPALTGLGDGIERWEMTANDIVMVDEITEYDIKRYAKKYSGVAFKTSSNRWIIKGIAPKMREEYES